MPLIAVVHLLIAIGFAVHAMRTGRPQYWMYILILVPLVGSIAYVLFELVPELAQTRRARRIAGGVQDIIAPDREFHRRGEPARARALFEDVVRAGKARRVVVTAADQDWLKVAKANL